MVAYERWSQPEIDCISDVLFICYGRFVLYRFVVLLACFLLLIYTYLDVKLKRPAKKTIKTS